MRITKAELLKKLNENVSVNEIIDSHLNIIGNNDDVETPEQIKTNATTDSYVDATRQQVGKNRLLTTFLEEDELVETNSAITGKKYHVPHNVVEFLQSKSGEGNRRIQGILQNPTMNYEQVKRFKHDIENEYQDDWTPAITWINSVLSTDRNMVDNQKRTTMEIGMENRFRKTHDKDYNSNLTPLSMNEEMKVKLIVTEEQFNLINESEDFNKYKVVALREMLKEKKDLIMKTKEEIKKINAILTSKIKNNIEENKK